MSPPRDEPSLGQRSPECLCYGWMWLTYLLALLWLFSPGLIGSQIPAFRDAYHFYYPQAVWLDRCADLGNLFPVWNSVEGLGGSVAGQPSAALYYPLRSVWLIPGLDVAQRFSLFIVVHLLIAAAGIRYASAKLKLSNHASWLAAISFSLSCPIFFQHNNPIYLCSAAWIGFAAGALLYSVQQFTFRFRECVLFALACSLMLLAGDPHTAANTFIIGAVVLCAAGVVRRELVSKTVQQRSKGTVRGTAIVLATASLWLLCAGLLVAALTAVQWIPAWRQAQTSARVGQDIELAARSQFEESSDTAAFRRVEEIVKSGQPPRHRVYEFSLPPWYLATVLWPTLGGDYLPTNSRSFAVLPAEGRMWIPAIYFGCLPCLLVLTALARKKSWLFKVLLTVAAFALLAALGSYSVVWILRELFTGLGLHAWAQRLPPDSVGGLYWLLCSMLPVYSLLRYPAKWTVWLIAACSLIAASQLNQRHPRNSSPVPERLRRVIQLGSAVGLCAALAVWLWATNSARLDFWLASKAPDSWLGPPDARATARSLTIAFAVPLLVVSINIATRFYALLTLAEMTLCASCWVSFLPPPSIGDKLVVPAAESNSGNIFVWADRSQANLLNDYPTAGRSQFAQTQADYQQIFWLGKLSNLADIRCLSAAQSIESSSLALLRTWLSRHDRLTELQPELDEVLRELGVTHRLVRKRFPATASQFSWHSIGNARALCEQLSSDSSLIVRDDAVTWRWLTSDELEVLVSQGAGSQLVIRQFNDGGWLAHDSAGRALAIAPERLFVLITLHGTESSVRLTRKWLW